MSEKNETESKTQLSIEEVRETLDDKCPHAEPTAKSVKEKDKADYKEYSSKQKDLRWLFYSIFTFTLVLAIIKFVGWVVFDKTFVNIDLSKLAAALNLFIVIFGTAEGIRSIAKTVTSSNEETDDSEETAVPSYKLRFLIQYLAAFACITLMCVAFDFYVGFSTPESIKSVIAIPTFDSNDFLNGFVSNVVVYLIARFGNKMFENIDLTGFKLFKK